jgi:hypothetical protein
MRSVTVLLIGIVVLFSCASLNAAENNGCSPAAGNIVDLSSRDAYSNEDFVRNFVWSHWHDKKLGQISANGVTREGSPYQTTFQVCRLGNRFGVYVRIYDRRADGQHKLRAEYFSPQIGRRSLGGRRFAIEFKDVNGKEISTF